MQYEEWGRQQERLERIRAIYLTFLGMVLIVLFIGLYDGPDPALWLISLITAIYACGYSIKLGTDGGLTRRLNSAGFFLLALAYLPAAKLFDIDIGKHFDAVAAGYLLPMAIVFFIGIVSMALSLRGKTGHDNGAFALLIPSICYSMYDYISGGAILIMFCAFGLLAATRIFGWAFPPDEAVGPGQ